MKIGSLPALHLYFLVAESAWRVGASAQQVFLPLPTPLVFRRRRRDDEGKWGFLPVTQKKNIKEGGRKAALQLLFIPPKRATTLCISHTHTHTFPTLLQLVHVFFP